jgi:hypothetical protein
MQLVIELSDAQYKALAHVAASPQEWVENAVHERCRIAIDEIVKREVDRKLAAGEAINGSKEQIVLDADIETALERNARITAQQGA